MDGSILPHRLPTAIDAFPDIRVLSLDCFDTLIWRDTHAPADLFNALPRTDLNQRMWAERSARIAQTFRTRQSEVFIEDIYARLLPNADAATRAAAVDAELEAEAARCFGFAPTIALMERARDRGLKIIIVSDTYLHKEQLGRLIERSAGAHARGLIDEIYCSSELGLSKASGLLKRVLAALHLPAREVLHVGDNQRADFESARKLGIRALRLRQFTDTSAQRLRLEAAVSAVIHSRGTAHDITYQSHRASVSLIEPLLEDPAVEFGFTALGPVLTAFGDWIAAEKRILEAAGNGVVHPLFLLRDGHLPRLVYDAHPDRAGQASAVAEISRFTSIAASFVDRQAILNFVEQNVGNGLKYLLTQLLYEDAEAERILARLPDAERSEAFMAFVGSQASVRKVLVRSAARRARMLEHVRSTIRPMPGDTVMLVDLGYNGSVQNLVQPILEETFGVRVAGRYLLHRAQDLSGYDKAGLIDERNYDAGTLNALTANVAVIEQLCTVPQGSVIDYRDDGTPIRKDNIIKGRQSEIRDRIQEGCVAFAASEGRATVRCENSLAIEAARRSAASVLARLMFLPQPHELALIAQFEHDVNLGTDGTVKLFDPDAAEAGLREHGLFYLKETDRMYLPAELRGQGMATSLTMLAMKRFDLGLTLEDFSDRSVDLPLMVASGQDVINGNVVATPTHDGYLLATVPVGAGRFTIAVQFGRLYDWLQIAAVRFRPTSVLLGKVVEPGTDTQPAQPTFEGIEQVGPDIFRCTGPAGFMMVPPSGVAEDSVLEVVFRPLALRQEAGIELGVAPAARVEHAVG